MNSAKAGGTDGGDMIKEAINDSVREQGLSALFFLLLGKSPNAHLMVFLAIIHLAFGKVNGLIAPRALLGHVF
jgi:hypothetical protein